MQTFICLKILWETFPEEMIGHWTFHVFKSRWKDYKKHPSTDVLCVNALFRLECFQLMAEIAI